MPCKNQYTLRRAKKRAKAVELKIENSGYTLRRKRTGICVAFLGYPPPDVAGERGSDE